MKRNTVILSAGFALFSMFFGSGNLVFPILAGQKGGVHFFCASLGIFITGVLLPLMGVLSMMLCRGDLREFFRSIGRSGAFIFSLIALTLLGPLGVLPRCLIVVHSAFVQLVPSASIYLVGSVFCLIIYLFASNKNKIIPALGTALTPLLILSIVVIASIAIYKSSFLEPVSSNSSFTAFKEGFVLGYQTMDLLAAFFFSAFVLNYLRKLNPENEGVSFASFLQVAGIGGGILASVYALLALLGSLYAKELSVVAPEDMLAYVALKTLGVFGAPCMAFLIILACLTTMIVLSSLFAEFLQKDLLKGKIGSKASLAFTLFVTVAMSTLEFSGIMAFLGPIVEIIYPSLIVLTCVNIAHRAWGFKNTHWPTTLTLVAKLCMAV